MTTKTHKMMATTMKTFIMTMMFTGVFMSGLLFGTSIVSGHWLTALAGLTGIVAFTYGAHRSETL